MSVKFQVARSEAGIPHVHATNVDQAWFGLGWAAAQDRLWQMEFDRRRAHGAWAEVVGPSALAADRLARRLQLWVSARDDLDVMDTVTVAAFEAYASGVNACVESVGLPPEYDLAGIDWKPWEPTDSVASFKVRHVAMGVWQYKVARAALLAQTDLATLDAFDPGPRAGMRVTVPPTARIPADDPRTVLLAQARSDVEEAAEHLGFLAEVEAGSNAWVLGPERTMSGAPLLASDSHRSLDVPNVYWQAGVHCDDFDVVGATFPGLPGFPHFGHNDRVGWAITNAAADAQDLYLEQFRSSDGDKSRSLRTSEGWATVEAHPEWIGVRGEDPSVEWCWRTPNGPVVHGDPTSGYALSLRWTAIDRPCRQFGVLADMLRARTAAELLEVQKPWVDPVNNLVTADVDGNIGYLLRGELPERFSTAATQVPVPGWKPKSHWAGRVAPTDMPRLFNPDEQIIVTANNAVTVDEQPFVSHAINDFYRVERIHELADSKDRHSFAAMLAWQGDTTSVAARRWADVLNDRGPYAGAAEGARQAIVAAQGNLTRDDPVGTVYACFRRELLWDLLSRYVGSEAATALLHSTLPGTPVLLRRWFAQLTWRQRPEEDMPATAIDEATIERCLSRTADRAEHLQVWGAAHRTAGHHTLNPLLGDQLDPPSVGIGGDNETIQNASYGWVPGSDFAITNLSVYRQVLDFADLSQSGWIVPGGVSGVPYSDHYADQLVRWSRHQLIAMNENGAQNC